MVTKIKEWLISVQLERSYTKEEILASYLNYIEFGSNSFGITVAAKTFFDKKPSELNYFEAASLVGSLNAPTAFNPYFNPERAIRKREEVLYNVFKYNLITRVEFDSLKMVEYDRSKYKITNQNEGPAPYFRTVIGNYLRAWCKKNG